MATKLEGKMEKVCKNDEERKLYKHLIRDGYTKGDIHVIILWERQRKLFPNTYPPKDK